MKMNLDAGAVPVLQVICYRLTWAVNKNVICSYVHGDDDDDVYDDVYAYRREI